MLDVTSKDLELLIKSYNAEAWPKVKKAYDLAKELHAGQKRDSGEDYIVHPLNVAYKLAIMHADESTICAGLLHDTLEDTKYKKEDLVNDFGEDVAEIVDGVTKINKLEFDDEEKADAANIRKIFTSLKDDVRIIIVKLADRLHNMETLGYKAKMKQREIAIETLELYVPIAYNIGAYEIKSKLEDLCLQYLKPTVFEDIREQRRLVVTERQGMLTHMMQDISRILIDNKIRSDITPRNKNIYGLFRKISRGEKIESIDDLMAIKVLVENTRLCYDAKDYIHELYYPVKEKYKDHIKTPKTNGYQSLHTTLFIGENKFIQTRIRTFDMDKIDTYGICANWFFYRENGTQMMEHSLRTDYPVYDMVSLLDKLYPDDIDFVHQLKVEALSDKVFVYMPDGKWMELPKGSCVIDYAYKLNPELANHMIASRVNNVVVPVDHLLNTRDRVEILTDPNGGPNESWEEYAHTSLARRLISEHLKK